MNILYIVRMMIFGQFILIFFIFSESGDNESNVGFWFIQSKLYCYNYIESICELLKININYLRVVIEILRGIYVVYFIFRFLLISYICFDLCDDFN